MIKTLQQCENCVFVLQEKIKDNCIQIPVFVWYQSQYCGVK